MFRKIAQKYPFHPLVWYILIETALSRIVFFMAMPFVALRMHDSSTTSLSGIGAIIGLSPLLSTFAGFFVGHISDLFERRRIIVVTLFLWSAVLWAFSWARTPLDFAILMGLNGLMRGIFEPVTAALISDLCSLNTQRANLQKHAFHFRYFAMNIGSSVGPVMGARLLIRSPGAGFKASSMVWLCSALLFWTLSHVWGVKRAEKLIERGQHSFKAAWKIFLKDRALQVYLLAAFFITFCYCQIESIFAVHLKDLYGNKGVIIFGQLLAINGITVVLFTFPVLNWIKRFDLSKSCSASALIFGLGFLCFGLSRTAAQYYFSNFIFTLGEIVIFSNGILIIESLAPAKMKGAYLGLSNISSLGFVLGPAIGGYLLDRGGGGLLFGTLASLMVVVSLLYLQAGALKRSAVQAYDVS